MPLPAALRACERPHQPSGYEQDPAARGRDTLAFTGMAIEAGLALGAQLVCHAGDRGRQS
jgi:hypothetical protein